MTATLAVNGVNGATGTYLLPELTVDEIARIARGETLDPGHLRELRNRRLETARHLGPDLDPRDLASTGWGVVFAGGEADGAVREALHYLLVHRQAQAGGRYQELAYRPGESKQSFLARHGMGPGPPDPDRVPYYLLLVGSPEAIPFRFQYQLDLQYAVGRLHFASPDEYAAYARGVVAAERGAVRRARGIALFGVENADDRATRMSARDLVRPLAERLAAGAGGWNVEATIGEGATKSALSGLLDRPDGPALLFTASHGMGFPNGNPRQLRHQGALLCQDWPGPRAGQGEPIPEACYWSADDIGDGAHPAGLVSFHFACYGAGTPELDDFSHHFFAERVELAPHPFVSRLPQRLLGHPRGGALAVIGHVERAWECSFRWPGAGRQIGVFDQALQRLLTGGPVGWAMELFNDRYAELAADLSAELEEIDYGREVDATALAGLWTANNDARSYIVLGDPAVRLAV